MDGTNLMKKTFALILLSAVTFLSVTALTNTPPFYSHNHDSHKYVHGMTVEGTTNTNTRDINKDIEVYNNNKVDTEVTVYVNFANICYPGDMCTYIKDEVLNTVDAYWNQYGIDHVFTKTYVNVQPGFQVDIPADYAAFTQLMLGIRFMTVPYVKGTDVVWFNTPMQSADDTNRQEYIGFGNAISDTLITQANINKILTEAEQVALITHELAHVYGLEHVDDKDNLMYYRLQKDFSMKLTDKQIRKAKKEIRKGVKQ